MWYRRKFQIQVPGWVEDFEAMWAAVYGVAQSQTQLKRLRSSSSSTIITPFTNYYSFMSLAIFFFKTTLTLLDFVYPYKFKISLWYSMRNAVENLIGIALKYPINMGENGHLDKTDSFDTWTWFIFWFIQVFNFFQ